MNIQFHRLLALGLGLPEESFAKLHGYSAIGESYGASYNAYTLEFLNAYPFSAIYEIVSTKFNSVRLGVNFAESYPYSKEDGDKANNVWLKGHTGLYKCFRRRFIEIETLADLGSMTILWSQPISALQILTKDGQWKWVRHIPNALVNLYDAQDLDVKLGDNR